ncbi:DEAD/DEAH box helicase [Solemya velum gill symbiont]|uniref:DEAD/DEAH box helicase n=1 Tax=Solemya velum gill symbiont TaxID=2340 RepID=UPI000997658B|nr:DEAD/DEAH box helicase [Solemya velum gill symbiont]OOY61059.1 ATP-dependent RNA helicase [Solemya velum gill symbiont]OOY71670.1 ATP-dependent RNA helicase [Solemya velum gill symbiont]
MADNATIQFRDLALAPELITALDKIGYEVPSPIQATAIPPLLEKRDIIGQAQTGTGKTAAFALPLLTHIKLNQKLPQVLVLTPTRELAIQVSEAFQKYASNLRGFHVLPIYGGQDYGTQIRALKRGVHVVVGTPGRVMDHMRKGTLKLDNLQTLVLDEADEMLRMGFIDDVEWVLEQTPDERQVALFSATMPPVIRRIANKHLNKPAEISIDVTTRTADTVRQRYWLVSGAHKLDAITRILEAETFDATIVFVRTKTATSELAEKLAARGYRTAALNGDIAQKERERVVDRLKTNKLDILIATDVAARGLDVPRISHVINYDIPHDTESYIHRIGRTGRAGRMGDAILFVAPRERRMLRTIERATKQEITAMDLPSTADINSKRIERFKQRITDTIADADLDIFHQVIEQYRSEHDADISAIAAALAYMSQGDAPLLLKKPSKPERKPKERGQERERTRDKRQQKEPAKEKRRPRKDQDLEGTEPFRIEVGSEHGVQPANIVGAVCNEAGLDSQYIMNLEIFDTYSTMRLPEGMPRDVFRDLKKAWVCGKQLQIKHLDKPEKTKRVHKATKENPRRKPKKKS